MSSSAARLFRRICVWRVRVPAVEAKKAVDVGLDTLRPPDHTCIIIIIIIIITTTIITLNQENKHETDVRHNSK